MAIDYTLNNKVGMVLSDDQNDIVEALLAHDYFFNCAQTGLGKTITTITAAIHKIVQNPELDLHYILLLPGSAVKAFVDTFTKILGIAYDIFTADKAVTRKGAKFHIFNYSSITIDLFNTSKNRSNPYFERLKQLKASYPNLRLIADEAHALQDPKTAQYRFVDAVKSWFTGIWFLTATPILNSLTGFYYMTDLLIPGFFKGIYAFTNKYTIFEEKVIWKYDRREHQKKPIKTIDVVGYKNLDVLQQRFAQISIIRSKHYDIDFIYRSTALELDSQQFYQRAGEGLFSGTTKIKKVNGKRVKVDQTEQDAAGARLHDLQRVVSNSHRDFKLQDQDLLTEKEVLLVRTIQEVINSGEAVLVYFSYLETLERVKYILTKIKTKFGITGIYEISGKVSAEARRRVESAIDPRSVVLITSAGTESVNLQRANNLIFYEIPFALRQFIQACGRIARTNSEFSKFRIYILEAEGTIDTYKKARILANAEPIRAVLGGSNILPVEVLALSAADKQALKDELLWWKG